MMVEDKFKNLNVVVRGGGSLISHRPVFSADASTLHIIQSSTLLSYSTKSNLLVSKFTTPGSSPIANIHVQQHNVMLLTQTGSLITLQLPDKILKCIQIDMSPTHWVPITSFIDFVYPAQNNAHPHFLALGYPQDSGMPVLYSVSTEDWRLSKLCWSVVDNTHSIGMSGDGRFVVAIQEGSLYCKDMRDEAACKWHSGGTRKFTCVAVHPTKEFVVATGDDTGRVVVWNNVMVDKSPAKNVLHWHTLAVADIRFSPEGSQVMSGGGECTLVTWELGDGGGGGKRTLPRMGLPIVHVNVSGDGGKIVVSHQDNCVQVVEGMRVSGVVKNVTWGVGGGEVAYGCGVVVDPVTGGIVMNGRPGWLQIFDFIRDRGVGDVDVCGVNYVTGERDRTVGNSNVRVVGFSSDGGWMGTGETRGCDNGGFKESRLKFWRRDKGKGVWVLSTVVEYPHVNTFGWVRFRPVKTGGEVSCVTSGGGKVFKVWGVGELEGGREFWSVECSRGFKDLEAGPCCYSSDGSLLAVGFGRVVTLWDVSSGGVEFKLSLCHQRLRGSVNLMEFGVKVNSHVVVCCGESNVYAWDVISGLLLWVVPEVVDCVGVDNVTGVVMCGRGVDIVFLDCEDGGAVGVYKDVSRSGVKGVGFVKGGGGASVPVFLNESGEVCGLMVDEGGEPECEKISVVEDDSRLTVFGRMKAEKRVSGGGDRDGWGVEERGGVGEKTYGILREIMDSSPHTMPSVKYYCTQLLRSLSKRTTEAGRMAEMEKFVMGLGRRKMEVDDRLELHKVDSLNTSADDTFSFDLDEVANEHTSWVTNVFN